METTLVLDVGYQPIACTPWQSAIVWVLDRVVEVVDEYPDRYIRTPGWQAQPAPERLLGEFESVSDLGVTNVLYRGRDLLRPLQIFACRGKK